MKICLSGSMAVIGEIEKLSMRLDALGHKALVPSRGTEPHLAPRIAQASAKERKAVYVADHLEKTADADAIVIANFEKDGVVGYVGTSALMEAAMAYALGKELFVLFEPADTEIDSGLSSLGAIKLNGDIKSIASTIHQVRART